MWLAHDFIGDYLVCTGGSNKCGDGPLGVLLPAVLKTMWGDAPASTLVQYFGCSRMVVYCAKSTKIVL